MKGNLPKLIGSQVKLGESYSVIKDINKNISMDNLSWRIDLKENDIKSDITIPIKIQKLAWLLRYYENSFQFLNEMNKMEKKIFMIEEDDREYWFYRYVIKSLFDLDEEQYLMIYKKNKIDNDLDIILPNLIQIASVHQGIVNTLDNTFMITKKNSGTIFQNLKTLIYKYRGFE